MASPSTDIRIRKVKALGQRAREIAKKRKYDDDDLVILETTISSLPEYKLTKIEGSPTQYLQKILQNG